jgi:hypothetical protein
MTVAVTLAAPPDLSVGRIRVSDREHEIGSWIASPTQTQHRFEGLAPGVYQAVAEPLGQPSRSFFFVLDDEDRLLNMPSLQAMSSAGFAISNLKSVAGTMLGGVVNSVASSVEDVLAPALKEIIDPSETHAIALGLSSCVDFDSASPRPYVSGPIPEITLVDNGVELVLHRPDKRLTADSFGLVLTCTVRGAHNVLGRVPLFTGGVRLALSTSPLGAADLTCRVTPAEINRRAITQALFAGSSAEATAVFKTIPGGSDELVGQEDWREDPWTSVAAWLLCSRFPDLAPETFPIDRRELAASYPRFPDVQVLLAHERLREVAKTRFTPQDRWAALNDALGHLQKACDAGPPYFAYAAQLAQDMLTAFAADEELKTRAKAQLGRFNRYTHAPRNAGASYVWNSGEIPARSGTLDPHLATVVFSGWVDHDRIALDAPRTPDVSAALAQVASPFRAAFAKVLPVFKHAATESLNQVPWGDAVLGLRDLGSNTLSLLRGTPADIYRDAAPTVTNTPADPPCMERPITDADDPHKGRFGGNSDTGGFRLAAKFGAGEDAKVVPITLSVSGEGEFESYDDVAEFFLHPTFRPDRLRATFDGRKAAVEVLSWGGFTVGVWLPKGGIELELDLATAPGAPKVVREL